MIVVVVPPPHEEKAATTTAITVPVSAVHRVINSLPPFRHSDQQYAEAYKLPPELVSITFDFYNTNVIIPP